MNGSVRHVGFSGFSDRAGWRKLGYLRFLVFQCLTLLVLSELSGLAGWLSNPKGSFAYSAALSCLSAGLSVVLPHWIFAVIALNRPSHAVRPRDCLIRLYSGQCLKMFLTLCLIAGLLAAFSLVQWAFFLGFLIMQFSLWTMPWFFRT